MRKLLFWVLLSLPALQPGAGAWFINNTGTAYARGDWQQEFAEVCGKTQNAMELSSDELLRNIDRCNELENRIHEPGGPQGSEKKVYMKRLKMCKDLYVYVLESREKKEERR